MRKGEEEMNKRLKESISKKVVKISKDIARTAVNKSLFIALYEPELSENVKKYCEANK